MTKRTLPHRRQVLRAAGLAVALPFLPSLGGRRAAQAAVASPKRFVAWYLPCGYGEPAYSPYWPEGGLGSLSSFPTQTKPLERIKDKVLFVKGITGIEDGMHDTSHTLRGMGQTSIDWVLAPTLKGSARFETLQFGVGSKKNHEYKARVSYKADQPQSPTADPKAIFDLIMGGTTVPSPSGMPPTQGALDRVRLRRQSVLDLVKEDLASVRSKVSVADKARLDRHTESIVEIEKSLASMPTTSPGDGGMSALTELSKFDASAAGAGNTGDWNKTVPNFKELAEVQTKLLALALASDATRVATLMFSLSNSDQNYTFIPGVMSGGHHHIGHYDPGFPKAEAAPSIEKIVNWYSDRFALFVEDLASRTDIDGKSVLDNTLIFHFSEYGYGGMHRTGDLPILFAGGGFFKGGQIAQGSASISRMINTISQLYGVNGSFGDTGTISLPRA